MNHRQIKLLLLDFDGTLVDTRRANTLAYVATLCEAGYHLTQAQYEATYFGMRCEEFLTRLGVADPAERERLRLRKIALYPSFFDTVRLNRPLWEFCCAFRAGGGKVWIVSTGSRANIDNVMRYLGIAGPEGIEGPAIASPGAAGLCGADTAGASGHDYITGPDFASPGAAELCGAGTAGASGPDGIVLPGMAGLRAANPDGMAGPGIAPLLSTCSDRCIGAVDGILSGPDVTRPKPDPACFLEAMRREGCSPDETLIFEDSPIGLEAARRSGAGYFKVTL